MNSVNLIGTISKVYGTKSTEKGVTYTNFSIEIEGKKKLWINCCKFGDFESSEGDYVMMAGSLSSRKDDNGKYQISVIASSVAKIPCKSCGNTQKQSDEHFFNEKPPLGDCPF